MQLPDKCDTCTMVKLSMILVLSTLLHGCGMSDATVSHSILEGRASGNHARASRPKNTPASRPTTQTVERPLTLPRAIGIALANNPGLAAARHDVDVASAVRDVAFGAILPKISAEGGYTMYREDRLIQPRRPGTSEVLGFTDQLVSGDFVLTMPLFMGGRLINRIKAAELTTESTRQKLLYSRTELAFNVSSTFYSMLGQYKVIDSLVFSQKALQEHHKVVVELMNAQKAAKVDLLRTDVRLADIEQRLIRERNVLRIQSFLLASLLGVSRSNENGLVEIDGDLTLVDVPANLNQGLGLAFSNRHDYQALKTRIEAQQRNLEIAKGELLPEVLLQASYGNRWSATSSDEPTDENEVGEIGVSVMIPLFEGGRLIAGIRRELSRLRSQRETLRELELKIQLEVETATSNIESTRARVDVTRKAAEQAGESLRIEREKYNLAKGAIVDVLDAQSALLDSEVNYYRALADYHTALAEFRLAVGETQ